jgi:type IV pilus assembly protein PilO
MATNINISLNLNKFKTLPSHFQILIAAILPVIIIILFFFLIYSPKSKEIDTLNAKIIKLDKEITVSESKISKLDVLIEENLLLKAKLKKLKDQLPEEKEVSELLKQISELGLKSGLEILLWKPNARKTEPGGLYVEIPVRVEVLTEYHKLGVFFSHISRLKRLVNISEMELKETKKTSGSRGIINAKFMARTFASVDAGSMPKVNPKGIRGARK